MNDIVQHDEQVNMSELLDAGSKLVVEGDKLYLDNDGFRFQVDISIATTMAWMPENPGSGVTGTFEGQVYVQTDNGVAKFFYLRTIDGAPILVYQYAALDLSGCKEGQLIRIMFIGNVKSQKNSERSYKRFMVGTQKGDDAPLPF